MIKTAHETCVYHDCDIQRLLQSRARQMSGSLPHKNAAGFYAKAPPLVGKMKRLFDLD